MRDGRFQKYWWDRGLLQWKLAKIVPLLSIAGIRRNSKHQKMMGEWNHRQGKILIY